MWRRCYALKLNNVHTLCYLYGALIQPVASYGCEVWAPSVLLKKGKIVRDGKQEILHNTFMRQALGVKEKTPTFIVLHELDRDPLWMFWLRQCTKFWNKVAALADTELTKHALLENVGMVVQEGNKECWAYSFLHCMCALGVIERPSQVVLSTNSDDGMPTKLQPFPLHSVNTAMQRLAGEAWATAAAAGPPRDIPSDQHEGFKLATHSAWFRADGGVDKRKSFARHLKWRQQITAVARFRMGSHHLDIESRRWGMGQTIRSSRVCSCCDMNIVEDEMHVVLECSLYEREREEFFSSIGMRQEEVGRGGMKGVMNGDGSLQHWQAVARFLLACSRRRAEMRKHQIDHGIIPGHMTVDM